MRQKAVFNEALAERAELDLKNEINPVVRKRLNAIITMCRDTNEVAAQKLGMSIPQIYRWARAYIEKGSSDALCPAYCKANRLSRTQYNTVAMWLETDKSPDGTKPVERSMARLSDAIEKEFGIKTSRQALHQILRRRGWRRVQMEYGVGWRRLIPK